MDSSSSGKRRTETFGEDARPKRPRMIDPRKDPRQVDRSPVQPASRDAAGQLAGLLSSIDVPTDPASPSLAVSASSSFPSPLPSSSASGSGQGHGDIDNSVLKGIEMPKSESAASATLSPVMKFIYHLSVRSFEESVLAALSTLQSPNGTMRPIEATNTFAFNMIKKLETSQDSLNQLLADHASRSKQETREKTVSSPPPSGLRHMSRDLHLPPSATRKERQGAEKHEQTETLGRGHLRVTVRPRSCEIQNGTSERNDTEIDQSDGKSYEKQEDESDEDSYVDILGESEMEIESRDIHISRQRRAEDEHEEGETESHAGRTTMHSSSPSTIEHTSTSAMLHDAPSSSSSASDTRPLKRNKSTSSSRSASAPPSPSARNRKGKKKTKRPLPPPASVRPHSGHFPPPPHSLPRAPQFSYPSARPPSESERFSISPDRNLYGRESMEGKKGTGKLPRRKWQASVPCKYHPACNKGDKCSFLHA